MQMFYLYIMYIFIDAKVNHTTSVKNNDLNLINHSMLYLQLARKI